MEGMRKFSQQNKFLCFERKFSQIKKTFLNELWGICSVVPKVSSKREKLDEYLEDKNVPNFLMTGILKESKIHL